MIIQSRTASAGEDVALLAARLGLGSLFIFSGIQKIVGFKGVTAFAAHFGVPFAPYLMPFAIALELIAATLLITGWRAREGAAVLAVWMFILNPWFHQFWTITDNRMMWQMQVDSFFHHYVMIGGMIYVVVFGPGRLALGSAKA